MHACTAPAAPFSSWPHPPPPLPRGLGCVGVSASSRSPIHFSFGTSSSTRRRPEPIPHTKGGDAFLSGHPRAPTASNHLLILAQQVADRMVEDKGTGRHAACHCAHTVGTWTWTQLGGAGHADLSKVGSVHGTEPTGAPHVIPLSSEMISILEASPGGR